MTLGQRETAITYWNTEVKRRTLYRFNWSFRDETGSDIGWWDGRHWLTIFGGGAYSPELVQGDVEELVIALPISSVGSSTEARKDT